LGPTRSLVLALLTPVLPLVLLARLFRQRLERRRGLATYLATAPTIALLAASWSLGECLGYLTGEP
ncbi:MAG TPA: hypothetical protein VNH46_13700, partial [Gemmatimonadales bacterium]|nr:hypothetical protein [Gemmatimonadales bacterium]